MNIVIPFEGRVRTLIRSSFLVARRLTQTEYSLSGETFQMTGICAGQVLIFPDELALSENDMITDDLVAQSLPLESFITTNAEEALSDTLGLLLRSAVADGKITDAELLRVAPALEGRQWRQGIEVAVGDVYAFGASLWRCIQAHTTQGDWLPDQAPALWHRVEVITPNTTRVWAVATDYAVGDVVAYPDADSTQYQCLQAHTSQATWEPPHTPTLWSEQTE